MSTRATIAIGEGWHVWQDSGDWSIWIEVEGRNFLASPNGAMVDVPIDCIVAIAEAFKAGRFHVPGEEADDGE